MVGPAGAATGAATGAAGSAAAGFGSTTLAFGLITSFLAGAATGSAADYPTFTSSYPIEAIISSLLAPDATLACICA